MPHYDEAKSESKNVTNYLVTRTSYLITPSLLSCGKCYLLFNGLNILWPSVELEISFVWGGKCKNKYRKLSATPLGNIFNRRVHFKCFNLNNDDAIHLKMQQYQQWQFRLLWQIPKMQLKAALIVFHGPQGLGQKAINFDPKTWPQKHGQKRAVRISSIY